MSPAACCTNHTADKIAGAVSRLPHVAAMIVPFDVVEAIGEMHEADGQDASVGTPGGRSQPGNGSVPRTARRTKKMLLDAECQVDEDQSAGGTGIEAREPIAVRDVRWRNRATLEGRIRSVYVGPVSGSPALEAELTTRPAASPSHSSADARSPA